jgi:CheY-like chemotaxis protein
MPRGTEHILLVDDEKSIADVTTSMLERLGYKVTMRISSYDALEAFRNLADRIDLLIADLTMPQMTGLQLYREIKKIRPDVKVIVCTGFSEQLDSRKSKTIGIEGFLNKPVVMADLARCVRTVLDS